MRLRIWFVVGSREALRLDDGIGDYAARAVFARHGAEAAIELLEALFELGESRIRPRVRSRAARGSCS